VQEDGRSDASGLLEALAVVGEAKVLGIADVVAVEEVEDGKAGFEAELLEVVAEEEGDVQAAVGLGSFGAATPECVGEA